MNDSIHPDAPAPASLDHPTASAARRSREAPGETVGAAQATRLLPGRPWPLGATQGPDGVNFALFSAHATRVWLCLLDEAGRETARLPLPRRTEDVWHGLLPGAAAGLAYGYRVEGPRSAATGHRFNPAKLLIDPYARRFAGHFAWSDDHLDNDADNARHTLRAVVDASGFDWQGDAPPAIPLEDTVLYEVHVKGATVTHPGVPERDRGRYRGLAAPAFVDHLKRLGVTAVSLLPVHQAIDERPLVERGLVNYWGYNTIGFFAPDARLAESDPVAEFREMVRGLHAAGLEVILDVVYNHTAEGDDRGPILSFRGIDNVAYYRLLPNEPAHHENLTGTGNALDASHPRVMQLVLDSLRYWVEQMHVDGFRFDLAPVLGRKAVHRGSVFSGRAALFQAIAQDPVLARVKLIAEPWDVGPGGYQLGAFPAGWSEWNDRYRDQIRAFWVRKAAYRGEIASRIAGSRDVFGHHRRSPTASVNYIAAHDGFTLHDVVSYDRRHNEANGEDNRDGTADNHSWNCGVEGPTPLLAVNALRGRLKRAMLATLFLSQGVPMLLGGDEIGRSQQGNNNAYNQDGPISWFDWTHADEALAGYVAKLAALRRRYPQLRRRAWLEGHADAQGRRDITWLNRRGEEMNERQWGEWGRYAFGFLLGGTGTASSASAAVDAADAVDAPELLVLINGEASDWTMAIPPGAWRPVLDTGQRDGVPESDAPVSGQWLIKARSLAFFERT
ncbi:MAG: glycogen debranching protein GlgX [Pseudomonadota bacterium]|nr:glycogen debranching protein GlgX [Pseudomonadota bacterium]